MQSVKEETGGIVAVTTIHPSSATAELWIISTRRTKLKQ